MKKKIEKIVLATGGTGGHVIPALETAEQFQKRGTEVFLLGNRIHQHIGNRGQGFSCIEVRSASFFEKNPFKLFRNLFTIVKGAFTASRLLKKISPDYVIGYGSYHCLPVLIAAFFCKVPIILYEQNITLGKVTKLFSRISKAVCGVFIQPAVFIGNEIGEKAPPAQYESCWKSQPGPHILVVGGSQGAFKINNMFLSALTKLKKLCPSMTVVHVVGKLFPKSVAESQYQELGIPHVVVDFEPQITEVMKMVDLVVTRAGARTMEELIRLQKPAVMIPYPGAYQHQKKNAQFFFEIGGGEWLDEEVLSVEKFSQCIGQLFEDGILQEKKDALRQYWAGRKLQTIVEFLEGLS